MVGTPSLSRKDIGTDILDFPEMYYVNKTTIGVRSPRKAAMAVNIGGIFYVNNAESLIASPASILDIGIIAADSIYYLYAVPSGSEFALVCSLEPPTYVGGGGPSGHDKHIYIGTFLTHDAASPVEIIGFRKMKGHYLFTPEFDSTEVGSRWQDSTSILNLYRAQATGTSVTLQTLSGFSGTKYPVTPRLIKVKSAGLGPNGRQVEASIVLSTASVSNYDVTLNQYVSPANTGVGWTGEQETEAWCDLNNPAFTYSLQERGESATSTTVLAGYTEFKEPDEWFQL
jgi:hypothetical protein